ncbi:MAG: M20 family metallopeptidase [Bacteroidia bacterium]
MNLEQRIKTLADEYHPDVVRIRRHIHAHPELSFQEFKTAKFIADELRAMNIEHTEGVADTGLVGIIKGKNPERRTIALRSDHDALPIVEQNEVPYKSQNEGIMHACGHDVHTASLLGAARILNEVRDNFQGTIKLIFQPGEERDPGGASLMIKAGVLDNPRPGKIYGQHVFPDLPVGKVGFRPGQYMASTDEIYVTIKGKGGHAALAYKLVDPILISSHIIIALQQIVSRNARPDIPSVLSFGKITGKGSFNIIPDTVTMEGTFRTLNEEWREKAHRLMKKVAEGVAASMSGSCDFEIRKGYPFLVNDPEVTQQAKNHAIKYLGEDNVVDLPVRMTGEDFAYYSQQVPGCFYRLGIANENKGIDAGLHTSRFNIDEDALKIGMGLMAWIACSELPLD